MASMMIRNIDEQLKQRLRMQAARHGRSMEEEVREILRTALAAATPGAGNLAAALRMRLRDTGGVELEIPAREPVREPLDFSE